MHAALDSQVCASTNAPKTKKQTNKQTNKQKHANKHKKTKQRLTDLQGELENSVVPTHKPHPADWIRAQGNSVDDLLQVLITIQPDVSGEQETYLIQAEELRNVSL